MRKLIGAVAVAWVAVMLSISGAAAQPVAIAGDYSGNAAKLKAVEADLNAAGSGRPEPYRSQWRQRAGHRHHQPRPMVVRPR
jgi:hypothetical protein